MGVINMKINNENCWEVLEVIFVGIFTLGTFTLAY